MTTTTERRGDWMQTFTGRQFWPLDPRPDEIDIVDIAHALAHICRFGGHATTFYSVAQHSIEVAYRMPDELKLAGLLHDAAEAYVGDMVRPLKAHMPAFREAEDRILDAIAIRFDLPPRENYAPWLRWADDGALATEARDVMAPPRAPWNPLPEPMGSIVPMSAAAAKAAFLDHFEAFMRLPR